MPLASKPGMPQRPKPAPPSPLSRRRCLGIITPETLEAMHRKAVITEDEYNYFKKLLENMHGSEQIKRACAEAQTQAATEGQSTRLEKNTPRTKA